MNHIQKNLRQKKSLLRQFHYLFHLGYDRVALLLIQNGADINVAGKNGTPLIVAAEKSILKNYLKKNAR